MIRPCRKCGIAPLIEPPRYKRSDYLCNVCNATFNKAHHYYEEYISKPGNKLKQATNMRRYRRDPKLRAKHIARWLLNRAVVSGKITKELCFCGSNEVEGHHSDYSKPLNVDWLCIKHHREIHARCEK